MPCLSVSSVVLDSMLKKKKEKKKKKEEEKEENKRKHINPYRVVANTGLRIESMIGKSCLLIVTTFFGSISNPVSKTAIWKFNMNEH